MKTMGAWGLLVGGVGFLKAEDESTRKWEITDDEAIQRALESVKRNSILDTAAPDVYPHVIEGSLEPEVAARYSPGAVEVVVHYIMDFGTTKEEHGERLFFGPPCEMCHGSTWTEVDGKKRGCQACRGTGVRLE